MAGGVWIRLAQMQANSLNACGAVSRAVEGGAAAEWNERRSQ